MSGPPVFTFSELASCAGRELRKRRQVYPGLVADRKFTQQFADTEIAKMEAIERHLRVLSDAEKRADDLFGGGNG
jgi:hypothetical protein